ncbi:MAG: hypothetical protein IT207_07580 [Fimbriimonadaceae bacterium]|nr:hypothetical protein [Fimbriimonadaceae bacterium]
MVLLALGAALLSSTRLEEVTLGNCFDTFLDAESPNDNFGRDAALVGGPRTAVLIRFPGIGSRLRPGKRVSQARLELRTISSGPVRLRSVGIVLKPWGEGIGRRILPLGTKKDAVWEATWNHARSGSGGEKWSAGGAAGEADARPLPNVSLVQAADVAVVTGLESAVQSALRNPDGDYGLRLEFDSDSTFMSSELPEFAPKLVVQQSDEPSDEGFVIGPIVSGPGGFTATVTNRGTSAEANLEAVWSYRYEVVAREALAAPLAPGASNTLSAELALPQVLSPAATQPIVLEIRSGSRVLATATTYGGALPVGFSAEQVADGTAGRVVRLLNEEAMPLSRYTFAPSGAPARFRVVSSESGPTGSLWDQASQAVRSHLPRERFLLPGAKPLDGSFGWVADTRDDVFLPPTRWLPAYRWTVRTESDPATPERGWLSAGEVLYLRGQAGIVQTAPGAAAVRCVGLDGKGIPGASVQVYRVAPEGERTLFTTAQTSNEGVLRLSSLPEIEGSLADFSLDVSKGAAKATVTIAGWQFLVESARSQGSTAVVDVGVMLSDPGIAERTDLASFKPVETSDGRLPAATASAVDGKNETAVDLAAGQWVEIDLGRDRLLGGIELVTKDSAWLSFSAETFQTGASAGSPWIRDGAGDRRALVESGFAKAVYTASTTSARRLRITNTGTQTVVIAEIRVFAASG